MAVQLKEEVRPEVKELLANLKGVIDNYWLPHVREFDALGGSQVQVKMREEWMAFWNAYKKAGIFGIGLPREVGGHMFGVADIGICIRDAGRWGFSGSMANYVCGAGAAYEAPYFLPEETRLKYWRRGADGAIMGFVGTEPEAGVDYGAIKATAVRRGHKYILSGPKWWCGNADVGPFGLNYSTVYVKTDPTKRLEGLSMFIVDNDAPGFVRGREGDQVGMRVFPRWEVSLQDCEVPVENRCGQENQGGKIMAQFLNRAYSGIAHQALGLALGCLEYTLEYTKKRVVFGSPICDYQGVHYKLADMAVGCETGWSIAHRGAVAKDNGDPEADKLSVHAKVFNADMCLDVTTRAMVLFAGQGYERGEGHPIERLWRDSIMYQLLRTANLDRRFVASVALGKKLKAGFQY